MPLQILLNGSRGRMGHAIATAAVDMDAAIVAATDAGDNPAPLIGGCEVIIDFSSHQATRALLELAVANRKPIVLGTTGHDAAEKQALLQLAAKIPCVWAGNFSVGVNLLFAMT